MKKTKRSIINIITSIIPSIIITLIGFAKFKYFIKVYGDDLNGIVQLITQIYAYLTLAELGFGAATNVKLYKYFQEKDERKITEVFNESKNLYLKSGIFIFVMGIFISFLLPSFIKNNTVPTYYVISIMILYAIDFLADYLYGLPYRNLLIVNEKIYVINLVKTTQQIIFKLLELILIVCHVNLILIILLSVIANLTGSYFLIKFTKKYYPFLVKYKGKDKTVSKSVKYIAINNLSEIVNEKTDSIIIANQLGLKDTSIYSIYYLINNYIHQFILNFVTGIKASIGAIVNDNKIEKETSYGVYKQFLLLTNYISTICAIVYSVSASSFVYIFIDNSYKVSSFVTILFGIVLWLNVMIKSLHVIIEVKGYYQNIRIYALLQAIFNIVFSFILVKSLGMIGVLLATVLSTFVVLLPQKAKIAFSEFDQKPSFFYMISLISFAYGSVMIYFINKFKIYSIVANLSEWFITTSIIFVFIAISFLLLMFLLFKEFRELVCKIKKFDLIFKIKRFILSRFSYVYYNFSIKNKDINVFSIEKTLDDLIKNNASIIRFGDGEMDLINGKNLKFQNSNAILSERLNFLLGLKSNDKLFIAIPEIFNGINQYTNDEKEFWAISLLKTYKNWSKHCSGDYYNAFMSRPYLRYKDKSNCTNIFEKIKKIYSNKDVILVEGEYSRLGVGNDLFSNVKSMKRILCPTKNAFEMYEDILKEVTKQGKNKIILVSLGPTSKPLVYDLYLKGYQAIDLGHIDLEYEWFLAGETKKVKVKNKYVNEVDNGDTVEIIEDDTYNKQILINLNKEKDNYEKI